MTENLKLRNIKWGLYWIYALFVQNFISPVSMVHQLLSSIQIVCHHHVILYSVKEFFKDILTQFQDPTLSDDENFLNGDNS
jgi:hypothetical protein